MSSIWVIYPGYCGPLVTAQNYWIWSAPSSSIRLRNHTPHTKKRPHLYKLKRQAYLPKKNYSRWRSTSSLLHLTIKHGGMGFSPPACLTQRPEKGTRASACQGLPVMNMHHLFQASGGVGLKLWPRCDIAVGTHVHLALHTRVWNPSHRRPTLLCLEKMPK
jgi:hypothetical protein